jgi:pyruvate/2-oxoacid:ferredoxin oxidoreductase beta subunit
VRSRTPAATASGLKRAAIALGKDTTAIAFAGDGGTFDIGLQALSGAAERGEKIMYICYDNEAYMNSGGQRSGSSPIHSMTKTTPGGKIESKKNILEIIAAQGVPYAATASIYHLDDFKMKLANAKRYSEEGLSFIQVIAPCNPGWGIDPSQSLRMAHLAVETKMFPLVEVVHGKWRITYRPKEAVDLSEYLSPQARFAKLTLEDIVEAKQNVSNYWEKLEKLEKYF